MTHYNSVNYPNHKAYTNENVEENFRSINNALYFMH